MAAEYPAALKTYTRQIDVASPITGSGYMDAADINTLQEEVEAVEAELGINPAGTAATVVARLDGIENDGNAYVAAGKKIGLEGSAGDSYFIYNASDATVDHFIDGVKHDAIGGADIDYIKTCNHDNTGTVSITANEGFFIKIYVPRHMTIDTLSFNVTTASAASKLADVGIYNAAGTKLQNATILVDTTGVKNVTITSQILLPGMYWLAISSDGAPIVSGLTALANILSTTYLGTNASAYPLPSTVPSLSASTEIVDIMAQV